MASETLFSTSDTPATITINDPQGVNLGVQFRSAVDGAITAISFYKGPSNTGPHTGCLWSADGVLLASVLFSGETASGWQTMDLPSKVPVVAGKTYVASYFTASGDYSATANYFAADHVSGDLTAPAVGPLAANGTYQYGSGPILPANSFNATNYWVDIVFEKGTKPGIALSDDAAVYAAVAADAAIGSASAKNAQIGAVGVSDGQS